MSSARRKNLKIGVSGVRGIVGETLSPALAADFAASFGGYTGHGIVIVGRDTRPSGEMIENAVVSGLLASGSHVLLAGIIPTPTLQIAVEEYDAAGAIAITASHNPADWNALSMRKKSSPGLIRRQFAAPASKSPWTAATESELCTRNVFWRRSAAQKSFLCSIPRTEISGGNRNR